MVTRGIHHRSESGKRVVAPAVATILLLCGVAIAAPTAAQNARNQSLAVGQTPVGSTLRAMRLESDVRIDGRLDESAWQLAETATGFTQSYPEPGAVPTQRTETRVLYDDQFLYVGVRAFDTAPDSIAAPLARRDAADIHSDWVHVIIDSRFDRTTAFRFTVNPRGVQKDVYTFDDGQEDAGWDAIWEAATEIDALGWTAELRIPLSQLRFGGTPDQSRTWGLQVMRDIARTGERASWSPWVRNEPGFVSRFGTLNGLDGLRPPRGIEILPYATARLGRAPGEIDDPFHRPNETGAAVGADFRAGLPRGMTLSATINPDFGQVEADPAEVNLTAFETLFGERRPFFTEGVDVFRFGEPRVFNSYGQQRYFYSRRIGRAPQLQLVGPEYRYTDAPQQTRILGAAKISGRTPDGWSLGIMNAVTAREEARYVSAASAIESAPVEPFSNYLVGRVRRDARAGQTIVGGLLTATNRDLDAPRFRSSLHESAYTGGIDLLHAWADRSWSLSGHLAFSRVNGSPEAIAATQRSAVHYYQRPDAEHLSYEEHRSSLTGSMAELGLQHVGRWDASLQVKQATPGLEMNDLGFHGRVDYRSLAAFLGRRGNQRGVLRDWGYSLAYFHAWNFGGDRIIQGANLAANGSLNNFWSGGINLGFRPSYLSDRFTRGGPLALTTPQRSLSVNLSSDRRRALAVNGDASLRRESGGPRDHSIGFNLDARPSTALRIRFGPRFQENRTVQYVGTFADSTAMETFGARYVFGELEQRTLSLETRLDWTFTSRLSLQLFAQPFVSAGDFTNFKEFSAPRTFDFHTYGIDRGTICRLGSTYYVATNSTVACSQEAPDPGHTDFGIRFRDPSFNVRSLRGNAVLRWEYRPGSSLFFVWQQDRSGRDTGADFDLLGNAADIFREPASNVFLIKASYWLGR